MCISEEGNLGGLRILPTVGVGPQVEGLRCCVQRWLARVQDRKIANSLAEDGKEDKVQPNSTWTQCRMG